MIDNYSHSDPDIMYITESIPGPAEDSLDYSILMGNYNSQLLHRCICRKKCLSKTCKCIEMSQGNNYNGYASGGVFKYKLKPRVSFFSDYPILECNSLCSCSAECGNRIVQRGPMEGLVVKPCENKEKGLGLFATESAPSGAFICEYAGELLTKSQALLRSKENDEQNKMNYIFCLNEHTYEGVIQTFVDPSKFGNIGRYINHSCDPSCSVVPVRYDKAIPHLAIFARENIVPGSEITFRYGLGRDIMVGERKSTRQQKPCFCNTERCEGLLPLDNF